MRGAHGQAPGARWSPFLAVSFRDTAAERFPMYRFRLFAWLLLAGTVPGGDCQLSTGPAGFCTALELEPSRADLRVGNTLRVRVDGLNCAGGLDCVDCASRRRRFRWRS